RDSRNLRVFLKESGSFVRLPGLCVSVCEKSVGTVKVVFGIVVYRTLQIGDGGGEVSKFDLGDAAPVERIHVIGARGDGFVVAGAGFREIAVVEIEKSEFFVVSGRRIVENGALEFTNAAAAREGLERGAEQAGVGNDSDHDRNERPQPS